MTNKPNDVRVSRVDLVGKYDEVLKPFAQMMEKELHGNARFVRRSGWLSMTADTCLREIYYRLGKLQKAVKDGNGDGICEYAADVANLSMMLTDICGALALFAAGQQADQQGEPVACMPVERCYDVRAKMIIAFNEAKKAGGDLDDHLDAAYKSALRFSPNPYAQPATAKVDERAEFDAAYDQGEFMPNDGPYDNPRKNQAFAVWQARAKLNGGQS